ncbi:response regulator [Algoriphagus sp. AK58]|uniref:response regulator n=1 Tax=Algoriphagus sp. AK58 TaxID=1406877 RepID=UPI00164FB4FC|nr:response regulator [Algoriphagus sp. AK58]MBC6365889.1 hypothetical protein [Algoriphagus sp. AK58]
MKETILLIEDEIELQQNLKEILEYSGFKLLTADHGQEAVVKLENYEIDLVICDIMMPLMDGFEVLEYIRSQEKFTSIPFIFLSAKARKDDQEKGIAMGADDYLTKPISARLLLNSVFSVLEKKKAKEQKNESVKIKDTDTRSVLKKNTEEESLQKLVSHLEMQVEAISKKNWEEVMKHNELARKCAEELSAFFMKIKA